MPNTETKGYKRPPLKSQLTVMQSQMEAERSGFLGHWRMLNDYILPRRARFSITDSNKGDRRNQNIIDSTATLATRTLRSGMMAGITSPARQWFRLTTSDLELAEFGPVKIWLDTIEKRMINVFLRSNLYNSLPILYGDMGVFATGAMYLEEDFESVIRTSPFPIGSYSIANNRRNQVDVISREFRMTVRQLIEEFGVDAPGDDIHWDRFSGQVKALWDSHSLDSWIDVSHFIIPNENYDPNGVEANLKKYLSVYYEKGASGLSQFSLPHGEGGSEERYLRQSGYDYFPVLCPRWEMTGEDVYGTDCPGMTALGDIRALQTMQKKKAQAIEKQINPPLSGPSALKHQKVSLLPGDLTYFDQRDGGQGLAPIHEVKINLADMNSDIGEYQYRVKRAFFEDLFLMLSTSDRRQITAREVEERHEEKLLALGPVLEQLNQDVLNPLIDIAFNIMGRQGLIPPPPEEIQGQELKVEYISILAQAQKLVGISALERFAGFAQGVISVSPESADKIDMDQMIDEYGDATSVPPRIIRSDDDVAMIREGRQKAAQQQAMMQNAQALTQGAKDLGQIDMSKDTALKRMMDQSNAGNLAPTA